MATSGPQRATLLFDGACGRCRRFAWLVRALDTRGRIGLVPLQDGDARLLFEPMLGNSYWSAFHLVGPSGGRVRSGADALEALAALLPAVQPFVPFLFRAPGVRRLPAAVYSAASTFRTCRSPATQG